MAERRRCKCFVLSSTHQFLQMAEGDGGAVEELRQQPALLVAAVADGSTCKKKKESFTDMHVYKVILRRNKTM